MKSSAKQPLLGRAVVCLSTIDWDFLWQGHQEIMSRIADSGDPVLFIDNAGVRTPGLSDINRLVRRFRNWWKGVRGFRQERPNLVVLSPVLLPFPYAWWARRINAWLINRSIVAWARAVRCDVPVVWTYLPTPMSLDVIDAVDPPISVYYCVDNFQASSAAARACKSSEARLFRKADIVFVTSRELQKKALNYRQKASVFPSGVDFEKFEKRRQSPGTEPADLAAIPRPRCGYVGGVHQWIDFDVLCHVAERNPKVSFVLVGPVQSDVSRIEGVPNIYLLGNKSHDRLPDYIGAFDLGMVPYKRAPYTDHVYPSKLNEYFAMGLPVVSSDLPEVRAYNDEHGGLICVARNAEEFSDGVATLAGDGLPARRQERIEAARANGWGDRLDRMARLIREKMSESLTETRGWADIVRRLSQRLKYQSARVLVAVLAVLIVLRLTPVVWWLAEPLRVVGSPTAADAIVVMGGGLGELGNSEQGSDERMHMALSLYRQGYAHRLLLCSSEAGAFRETKVMRAIALEEGVPDSAILVENQGGGTRKMILAADAVARRSAWKRVLLVSSPYHMRRALMLWSQIDGSIAVVPTPARRSRFYGYVEKEGRIRHRGAPTFLQIRGIIREYAALAHNLIARMP